MADFKKAFAPDIRDRITADTEAFNEVRARELKLNRQGYRTRDDAGELLPLLGDFPIDPSGKSTLLEPPSSPYSPPNRILEGMAALPGKWAQSTKEYSRSGGQLLRSGLDDIKSGFNLPHTPTADPKTWYGGGLLKTAAGGLGTVLAPLSAAIDHLVVEPVANLTGSKEIGERAGFVTGMALPLRMGRSSKAGEDPARRAGRDIDLPAATLEDASVAARNPLRIYDAPNVRRRPFSADYPGGAQADATGRLLYDIDGRPISAPDPLTGAPFIAGRTTLGGPDVALTPAQIEELVKIVTGSPTQVGGVPAGYGGLYSKTPNRAGGYDTRISISDTLRPAIAARTKGHELGHAIEDVIGTSSANFGRVPYRTMHSGSRSKKVEEQVDLIFHDLNTRPNLNFRPGLPNSTPGIGHNSKPVLGPGWKLTTPSDLGYGSKATPFELGAETVRAYMTNPNYFKTVAPDAAAWLRQAVNNHPWLSRYLRLNTLLPPAVAGPALLGPVERDQGEAGRDFAEAFGAKRKAPPP